MYSRQDRFNLLASLPLVYRHTHLNSERRVEMQLVSLLGVDEA